MFPRLVIVLGLSFGLYGWAIFYWANLAGVVIGGPAALITWAVLCPERLREVGWFGLGEM